MSRSVQSRRARVLAAVVAALALVLLVARIPSAAELSTRTVLGNAVALGNGTVRTYLTTTADGTPVELGVAVTEAALTGLPHHGGSTVPQPDGHVMFEHVLPLPAGNPTPFKHVVLNWNPGGHEPPGIYDTPHFDVHFYTISGAERIAIDAADPEFQRKAERRPAADLIPKGYILPAPVGFPQMGVHWVDPTSPELNGKPFTSTFIYGSWNGNLIFAEPMFTKAFLESKPQFTAPLPAPARYQSPGYYPSGYSVKWEEAKREYRIALVGLVKK